jgi:large subunit ribosomal protein L13
MKTYSPRPGHVDRRWYVLDASGQVLGRIASEAATLLRGKHKPIYAPHVDTGDHVIIVNADKVELSGGKVMKKFAYRHSGYPGGITATRYDRLMAERPVFVIEKAVRGMLPKNRLGRAMFRKLHVVAGPEHPHAAQRPVAIAVGERPSWGGLPAVTAKEAARSLGQPAPAEPPVRAPAAEGPPAPAKKPAAKKPAAKKPAAKKPAAKKPAAKKPAAKKPAATTRATAQKPGTRKSAATPKKPTKEE